MEHLGLLVAHRVGVERNRRLHRGQGNQLEQVIGHHVAQRAGRLVITAARLDAHGLGGCDLHVINVAPVPDRLENAVAEPEHDDVLHRLFAEVVIDAINLALLQRLLDLGIERAG